jgi:tRNA(Leu) C34 or U34 (ribose-2'-O)-methylase TrmL
VDADVALTGTVLKLGHAKVRSQIFTWLRPEDKLTFSDVERRVRHFETFAEAVEHFRAQGRRIIGASPHAKEVYCDVKYSPTDVLAFGHEESGLSQAKLAMCDLVVKIPMPGGANSLNVSDAAAIILYEALRQFRTEVKGLRTE